ncbi:MAG: lytic transglycosylase domain-containing protein, partial [Gemmatimonadaceae bacterium]
HDLAWRAIPLGWRALIRPEGTRPEGTRPEGTRPEGTRARATGVARDARLYRFVYPVTHRDVLVAEAARGGLDPALVAAVIRQESAWNPRATSPVGARGLMQVMPSVGATVARSLGLRSWDPVLLYEPEVSVALGVRHLSAFVRQNSTPERALAAYNAGQSRVARWARKRGADDPEVFVERIPFAETRDYVRIVLRNAELYRALYAW